MQKLKEKDIIKIFPTLKPHYTTKLVLKIPKTEVSNRIIWLPRTLALLFVKYKKSQQELREFLEDAYNNYNLVVSLKNGNPVESCIVRDRFQNLCEEHNFEIIAFHSLCHLSTCYKLKMTDGAIKSVQGDTGHSESEMVKKVYSEVIYEDRHYNAQKLDDEFYGSLDEKVKEEPVTTLTNEDALLLQLSKAMSPEMKEKLLKQSLGA